MTIIESSLTCFHSQVDFTRHCLCGLVIEPDSPSPPWHQRPSVMNIQAVVITNPMTHCTSCIQPYIEYQQGLNRPSIGHHLIGHQCQCRVHQVQYTP
ncbi:hypothetical protein [Rhodococcus sp. IEGM 1330]|uniref:hypothetical protein n=1 Tax=Rhodococcus sp. IEGM 1330 TaxID=3082225 RepID=UPI00295402AA|nr:hypothetical protein [Rhodococcus sp. IEGM 1330]MDV8023405.1 hypothetical protein [Rhodococcus sp. IEGM 1330]